MTILPNQVAVTGSTHHAEWCVSGLIHDPWMAGQMTKHLSVGDVVIEGGAHIGTLTRAILDAGSQVMAFEPNPDAAACLRHNCPEAVVFNMALGESEGECTLEIVADNAGMTHVKPGQGVRVAAIDRFVSTNIRLIKLDCEGAETEILRGAKKVIEKSRPVMIIEVNSGGLERAGSSEGELLAIIKSLGYRFSILQPQCGHGDPQYDIECLPNG